MLLHRQFAVSVAAWVVVWTGVIAETPPKPQNEPISSSRIALDDLRTLLAAEEVLIVDVRDTLAFKGGHIPGAINVPVDQIEARVAEISNRAHGRHIVTYCACPDEHTSATAAAALSRQGVRHVSALIGGLRAWIATGGRLQT